jgi:hypothetical protein
VSEKVAVFSRVPAVAFTVTVAVTGPVGVEDTLDPPHPFMRLRPSTPTASNSIVRMRRRFLRPRQQRAAASIAEGNNGRELGRRALTAEDAETVSVVVAVAPAGVTIDGEKLHDASTGNPEQLKETAALKPFCGVMDTRIVPLCPEATVKEEGATETVKFAGG